MDSLANNNISDIRPLNELMVFNFKSIGKFCLKKKHPDEDEKCFTVNYAKKVDSEFTTSIDQLCGWRMLDNGNKQVICLSNNS